VNRKRLLTAASIAAIALTIFSLAVPLDVFGGKGGADKRSFRGEIVVYASDGYPLQKGPGENIMFRWTVKNTGTVGISPKVRVCIRVTGTEPWTDMTGSEYPYSPLLPGETWDMLSWVGFVIPADWLGKSYDVQIVLKDSSRGDRVLDTETVSPAFIVVIISGEITAVYIV